MKEIVIDSKTHGRHTVLIDDDDFGRVNRFKWGIIKSRKTFYACRKGYLKQKNIFLHRYILNLDNPKVHVDHRNHNGLDCQKENIRTCTIAQNAMNRLRQKNNTTGFKGVRALIRRYRGMSYSYISAHIAIDGKETYIGMFPTLELAARAYDEAAIKHYGEFACLNFPEQPVAL